MNKIVDQKIFEVCAKNSAFNTGTQTKSLKISIKAKSFMILQKLAKRPIKIQRAIEVYNIEFNVSCSVTFISGAIDEDLDENNFIRPGLGDFGDKVYHHIQGNEEAVQAYLDRLEGSIGLTPKRREALKDSWLNNLVIKIQAPLWSLFYHIFAEPYEICYNRAN